MTPDEIRTIRKGMNLSQTDFARLLGVAQATVSEWEQGKYEVKGAALTLLRIARSQPTALRNLNSEDTHEKTELKRRQQFFLKLCEAAYINGDRWSLMIAVRSCIVNRLDLPEWVYAGMNSIEDAIGKGDIRYWEDAFGNVCKHSSECLQELDFYEQKCAAGEKSAILSALCMCFTYDLQVPKWLRSAFSDAYERLFKDTKINTWDDVFGRPFIPKAGLSFGRAKRVNRAKILLRDRLTKVAWRMIDESEWETVKHVAKETNYCEQQIWNFLNEIKPFIQEKISEEDVEVFNLFFPRDESADDKSNVDEGNA